MELKRFVPDFAEFEEGPRFKGMKEGTDDGYGKSWIPHDQVAALEQREEALRKALREYRLDHFVNGVFCIGGPEQGFDHRCSKCKLADIALSEAAPTETGEEKVWVCAKCGFLPEDHGNPRHKSFQCAYEPILQ